jgi:predicted Rossmann fold nucleotide-binding protein DprA/Smf involved in DNA uptake
MAERVAIIGAREHPDLDFVRAYVRTLPTGTTVVSGGAKGVDSAAATDDRRGAAVAGSSRGPAVASGG